MLANNTEFGLAAYFYTKDLARAWKVAEDLDFGGWRGVGWGEVGVGFRTVVGGGGVGGVGFRTVVCERGGGELEGWRAGGLGFWWMEGKEGLISSLEGYFTSALTKSDCCLTWAHAFCLVGGFLMKHTAELNISLST